MLVLGVAALVVVGAAQLAKDGSFWRDEASVAQSLLELSPLELFGALRGGQSFPRLYLAAVQGLKSLFGYETLVVRALPFCFFVLGSAAWGWLLHRRLREQPLLLLFGFLLSLVPAQWFVQAAMLKPYTLDVFAAMLPFLLPDDFYDSTLARGERRWRLFALTAVGALSYPFALASCGRVAGWWAARLPQKRLAVDPPAAGLFACGTLLFVGCLWLTDLRHTAELSGPLERFWQGCVLGAEGTDTRIALERLAFAWYTGETDFSRGGGLPQPLVSVLKLAFAAGVVRIAASMWLGARAGAQPPAAWGSRSLGHAALLCGLLLASLLVRYPVCPGRLTLFALLPLQVVTFEGFAWAAAGARRLPASRWLAVAAGLALVATAAPSSIRDANRMLHMAAPDDLRPALAIMRERPDLPVIATTCTTKQIETLPEGITHELFTAAPAARNAALANPEAWVLYVPAPHCRSEVKALRAASAAWTERWKPAYGARLALARFESPPPN